AMYETSAHLAQMARQPETARMTLTVIASYAFADACNDRDCLAALVILDELAAELGHRRSLPLVGKASYRLTDIAARYIAVAGHSPDELANAAGLAWERLFQRPLPHIAPL
ncbi:MAG: hypothetical protein AAGC55_06010, partial [Myxococcota bacterium]